MNLPAQDSLSRLFQQSTAQAVVNPDEQQRALEQLQGSQYQSNLDANHSLQVWAKRLTDAIVGPDTTTSAVPGKNDKWKTWVPVVLLGLAVWLIFSE